MDLLVRNVGRVALLLVAVPCAWWPFAAESGAAQAEREQAGLAWVFFNDVAMRRPAEMGVDRQIRLDTGNTINDYARVWIGRVRAPRAGEVTFHAEADNGLRLWLGGRPVLDGWSKPVREGTFAFARKGQRVPLLLHFFQLGGTAHLRLYWSWPGHPRELIPASALWHTEHDMARAKALRGATPSEQIPPSTTHAQIYGHSPRPARRGPLRLEAGPHLFLDDFLIDTGIR